MGLIPFPSCPQAASFSKKKKKYLAADSWLSLIFFEGLLDKREEKKKGQLMTAANKLLLLLLPLLLLPDQTFCIFRASKLTHWIITFCSKTSGLRGIGIAKIRSRSLYYYYSPIETLKLHKIQSRNAKTYPLKNKNCKKFGRVSSTIAHSKETTLERADFTLQLLMCVTTEKESRMFTIFLLSSFFCQLLSPRIQARTGWVRSDQESSGQPA